MLDPAGDAHKTGRVIDDMFERGITLQYAQELKKELEQLLPSARIILTRFPGETVEPLQSAAFANKLGADLYIALSFYKESTAIPRVWMYHMLAHPTTDFWNNKSTQLKAQAYNQAHRTKLLQSQTLLAAFAVALKPTSACIINPPCGIPYKPLVGVQAPACGLEIGLPEKNVWKPFIKPVAEGIHILVNQYFASMT